MATLDELKKQAIDSIMKFSTNMVQSGGPMNMVSKAIQDRFIFDPVTKKVLPRLQENLDFNQVGDFIKDPIGDVKKTSDTLKKVMSDPVLSKQFMDESNRRAMNNVIMLSTGISSVVGKSAVAPKIIQGTDDMIKNVPKQSPAKIEPFKFDPLQNKVVSTNPVVEGGVKGLEPLAKGTGKLKIIDVQERPLVERYLENPNLNKASRDSYMKQDLGNEVVLQVDRPMTETEFNKYIYTIEKQLPKYRIGFREKPLGLSTFVTQRVQPDGTAKVYLDLNRATKSAKEAGYNINYNQALINVLTSKPKVLNSAPKSLIEGGVTLYHATPNKFNKFDLNKTEGGVVWFTDNPKEITNNTVGAVQGTGQKLNIITRTTAKEMKWATPELQDKYFTDQLIQQGYDGVKMESPNGKGYWYKVFDPNKTLKEIPKSVASTPHGGVKEGGVKNFKFDPLLQKVVPK